MTRLLHATLLSLLLSFTASAQTTVGGVQVESQLDVESHSLQHYGSGIRSKFFFKLYVGSLYAEQPGLNATQLLSGEHNVAVSLDIISNKITSERMRDTIEEGFEKASAGNMAPLRERLDSFVAVFDEKIEIGDQFLMFANDQGQLLAYKNQQLLTTVEGADFAQTLFAIWLGEQPADDKLKSKMLGN